MPNKYAIRPARVEDANAVANVHTASWKTTYNGIISELYLNNIDKEKRASFWVKTIEEANSINLVLEIKGEIVGFLSAGKNRIENDFFGEIYAIYLLKEWQGRGFGKQLFLEGVRFLLKREFNSMELWVLSKNPSKGFYLKMGGTVVESKEEQIGEQSFVEEAIAWSNLQKLVEQQ